MYLQQDLINIIIIVSIQIVHGVHDRQKRQTNKSAKIPQKHILSS